MSTRRLAGDLTHLYIHHKGSPKDTARHGIKKQYGRKSKMVDNNLNFFPKNKFDTNNVMWGFSDRCFFYVSFICRNYSCWPSA